MPAAVFRSVPAPLTTFDLMEALKRSIEKSVPPANDAKPAKVAKGKSKPRDRAQGELLLPIAGKKAPVGAAKSAPSAAPGRRRAS